MSQQIASTEQIPLANNTVVDTDVHLSIGAENLAEYLDEPHKSRAVKKDCFPASTGKPWDKHLGGKAGGGEIVSSPDVVERRLINEFGIDYPILNAITPGTMIPDSEFANALMPATNNALLDMFLDDTDLLAFASVCQRKPAKAAEEIDRMANEDQIVGVYVFTASHDPPMGDPRNDPIYQAAEDNGLSIAYHGGAASAFRDQFPIQNQQMEKFLEVHTLAHAWQSMMTLSSLIVHGTFEKFPGLNFLFLEAGISWVPYMMWRFNKETSIRRSEAPLLEKSPEEYIRDQCYFGTQPLGEPNDPAMMKDMIDMVGADSLTFATDYPHWDFDNPEAVNNQLRRLFDDEERERVMYRSAAECLNLDI